MPRIDGIPPGQGGAFARSAHAVTRRQYGRHLEVVSVGAVHPRLLVAFGVFDRAVEEASGVDKRLKALASLKAATIVGCEFCLDIGSAIARTSGLTDAQLTALSRHRESELFSPLEKSVLDYADAMSRTPPEVSDDLFARLREYFSERQIVELTYMVGWENLRARTNHAFGIGAAGFCDGAVCAAPEADPARVRA